MLKGFTGAVLLTHRGPNRPLPIKTPTFASIVSYAVRSWLVVS